MKHVRALPLDNIDKINRAAFVGLLETIDGALGITTPYLYA